MPAHAICVVPVSGMARAIVRGAVPNTGALRSCVILANAGDHERLTNYLLASAPCPEAALHAWPCFPARPTRTICTVSHPIGWIAPWQIRICRGHGLLPDASPVPAICKVPARAAADQRRTSGKRFQ